MPIYDKNHKLLGHTIETWIYKPEGCLGVFYAKKVRCSYYTVLAEDYFKA